MIQNVLMWLRQGLVMAQWAQFYQCRENRPISLRGCEKASRCGFKIAKLSFSTDLKHQPLWMNKGIWHFTHLAHIYLKCVELSVLNTVQHCNAGEDSDEWPKRGRVSSRPLWPQPKSFTSMNPEMACLQTTHTYGYRVILGPCLFFCGTGTSAHLYISRKTYRVLPSDTALTAFIQELSGSPTDQTEVIIHAISFIVLWLVRGRGKKAWRSCGFQLIWIEIE